MYNLHNNKHGIVMSWVVKGQGGDGNFNEQNNDYIKKNCNLGYINDVESENKLIRELSILHWFKTTIMVFRKKYVFITLFENIIYYKSNK
jgi:hypothetical protein